MDVSHKYKYPVNKLIQAYGIESSYGKHPDMNKGLYQGPFQFSRTAAKDFGLSDRHDLQESAEVYITSITKRDSSLRNMISNETGNFTWLDSLDPMLKDYLLHQQGPRGLAQLSLAREGYQDYYNKVRVRIKPQLSKSQFKHLAHKTKTPEEAIDYYIDIQKEKLNIKD